MTGNNPKLDLVNVDDHKNLVRFCQFVLKILSGNEILASSKGRNSVKILRKVMGNNLKLEFIYQIWSDSERKQNFDIKQGPMQN